MHGEAKWICSLPRLCFAAMAEEAENLTLPLLRRIDARMDRLENDMRDVKVRLTSVEMGLATVNSRLDRMEDRLQRIERRLDLVDVPAE
jgi:archaellum component FlaC